MVMRQDIAYFPRRDLNIYAWFHFARAASFDSRGKLCVLAFETSKRVRVISGTTLLAFTMNICTTDRFKVMKCSTTRTNYCPGLQRALWYWC